MWVRKNFLMTYLERLQLLIDHLLTNSLTNGATAIEIAAEM